MTKEGFKDLLEKSRLGNLTPEESQTLSDLLRNPSKRAELEQLFDEDFSDINFKGKADNETLELIYRHIILATSATTGAARVSGRLSVFYRVAAAAAVLVLLVGVAVYFLPENRRERPSNTSNSIPVLKDVPPPQGSKASLTLADGTVIILDSARKGLLGTQGNTVIQKVGDDQLSYLSTGNEKQIIYNHLQTPRGGQYQLTLQDGTKVWINAASSLRFPTRFTGNTREVELNGEAYFEVAKNKDKPFKVLLNGMKIEVLGTHFNVMGYGEENMINTTLFEGSVKIATAGKTVLLVPGQQAVVHSQSANVEVGEANTEEVMAWKNGRFEFNSADVGTIMRNIARWYDVEVAYDENISPQRRFTGSISRNVNVSQVLRIMELGGVRFKIEGRKITLF